MGGIFLRSILMLFTSVICAYLYLNWLPIPRSLSAYHFLLEFVLNPVEFFAAAITFFVGFMSSGIFIRDTMLLLKKNKQRLKLEVPINIILFIIFLVILLQAGFWQMTLFFCFAFVYGMMTIVKINHK
jgi:hypothetical protein